MLLRYIFSKGEAQRLRYILTEDVKYMSEAAAQKKLYGRDEIIEHLTYVNSERKDEYFAHLATIISIDDNEGEPALAYNIGTRCIVLASKEEDNYESIVFIDVNGEGCICNISISTNSHYHFKLDEQFKPISPLDDIKMPESVCRKDRRLYKYNKEKLYIIGWKMKKFIALTMVLVVGLSMVTACSNCKNDTQIKTN